MPLFPIVMPRERDGIHQSHHLIDGKHVRQGACALGRLDLCRDIIVHDMLAEGETMKGMNAGQSTSLAAGALPRIVERGHIFLDMPCGHVIEIMDTLFMQPGHVFMQVGTVRADRGLGQSPFHVNVREELPDQTFATIHVVPFGLRPIVDLICKDLRPTERRSSCTPIRRRPV